jgi:hypothetical protein
MFKSNKTPTIEAGQHYKFLELVLFYINFNFVQIGLRYRSPPIFWRVHSFGLCVVFYRSLLDILSFFLLSLYCLSFFYLRLLITSLVSSSFSLSFCPFPFVIVLSVLLLLTTSDYIPLWYLQAFLVTWGPGWLNELGSWIEFVILVRHVFSPTVRWSDNSIVRQFDSRTQW